CESRIGDFGLGLGSGGTSARSDASSPSVPRAARRPLWPRLPGGSNDRAGAGSGAGGLFPFPHFLSPISSPPHPCPLFHLPLPSASLTPHVSNPGLPPLPANLARDVATARAHSPSTNIKTHMSSVVR